MEEDSPVYQVTFETAPNATTPRSLHRNLMLPGDDLPLEQPTRKLSKRGMYPARETLQFVNLVSNDSDNEAMS